MKTRIAIVGRTDGRIERHAISVPENGNTLKAIWRYGSRLQDLCGDVAGITMSRGILWTGGIGNADACPALADWTDARRSDLDVITWDKINNTVID